MKHSRAGWVVAIVLGGASVVPAAGAQEADRVLPTLLIKGEVVSLDTNDPAAMLLKVKDRYGFETPIYLAPETKITQGDQALSATNLQQGTAVEVEYNFDINTAKRHAVSVTLSAPSTTASAAASQPTTPSPAPVLPAPVVAPEAIPAPTSDLAPAQPEASVAPEQPTEPTP